MEVLLILVGAIAIYFFAGCFKMYRMNGDISQQQLAGLLSGLGCGDLDKADIVAFFALHGWGKIEAMKRIAHALTITKRISNPIQYEIAQKYAMEISRNYVEYINSFQRNLRNT